jgi:hypothetical protein
MLDADCGKLGGIAGSATDKGQESGVHVMQMNGDNSMSMRAGEKLDYATDECKKAGVHVMQKN